MVKHFSMGNVSDSAIVFAYYSLLSLFPILISIGGVIRLANANPTRVIDSMKLLMPSSIYKMLQPIVESAFSSGHGGSNLSVGLIIAIWSASSAMAAFQRAVNRSYGVLDQSAFMNRVISFLWMLLLVVFLFVLMILLGFGQALIDLLNKMINMPSEVLHLVEAFRIPFIVILLVIILSMIYFFVPSLKTKWKYTLGGTLFALLGLSILSQLFSQIIGEFFRNISAYKTLGTFIVVMIWLYLTGMVLLIGSVINASVHDYFIKQFTKKGK
ncbi:ribonuclease BN [Fructilactobacillus sanfranciscensis]|nr:YihY/virulence factor BrkB family protein [Fructilactobacillus sanfranciscensis]POH10079.1 ribonuclease BN [Fructilactobacillus sanfranciscensis]POH10912.1 ribonuclease BN [Fructilactobacillus sanfranciscensis]POH14554.1 ribonuclease BN [Fructilactobacillus sanfranciscensis]